MDLNAILLMKPLARHNWTCQTNPELAIDYLAERTGCLQSVWNALPPPICCSSTEPGLPPSLWWRYVEISIPRNNNIILVRRVRTYLSSTYLGVLRKCASKIARLARLALKATSIIVPNSGINPAPMSMPIFRTCGRGTDDWRFQ
jgi:hypothetical protein